MLQHVNIKVFASKADIDLVDAIPVFHRWIQENAVPELMIDVADYKHVPDGPGVMLIGHEANYSLDETDGRLGLLYNRKATVEGDDQAALGQAFQAAVAAAKRLEAEPVFAGKLTFDTTDVEVIVNDRLIAQNDDATWAALEPAIRTYFSNAYDGPVSVTRLGEPRDRFMAEVKRA